MQSQSHLASRVADDAILKDSSDCCSRGNCKPPKTCDPLSSVLAGCCQKKNTTDCATRAFIAADETIAHEHCHEDYGNSLGCDGD